MSDGKKGALDRVAAAGFQPPPALALRLGRAFAEAAIGMPDGITFTGDGVARDRAPWIIANPIEVVE